MKAETSTSTPIRTRLRHRRPSGYPISRPGVLQQLCTRASRRRILAVFALLSVLVLAGPLAGHADGPPAGLTEEGRTEPPPPLRPDQVRFAHITTEDGLAEGRVWGIAQDRRGFLWFTTYDGINRYDGHEFKVYKHDPENPNSPASTTYRCVLEDSRGMLWFGSISQGLSRFDPQTECWTNFEHDPQDPQSLSGNAIWGIAEDPQGDLWIATEANGLSRWSYESGHFSRYRHDPDDPNSLGGDQIIGVAVDRSGVVWAGTQFDGLSRFDPATGQWTRYRHDPEEPNSLGFDHVHTMYEDRAGALWIGTWGRGLDRLDENAPGEGSFTHYRHDPEDPSSLSDNYVVSIYQDRSGTLWVATYGGGLNQLLPDGAESPGPERTGGQHAGFVAYQHDPIDAYSLSNNVAAALFEDREGLLWVGTEGGVNKLDLQPKRFALYRHQPGNPNSLGASDVRAIYEDRFGDLWVGTHGGGLDRIERTVGSAGELYVTHYLSDPADPATLTGNQVISIAEDRAGSLWVGTQGAGFNRFDRETGTFERYESDPASSDFRPGGVRAIYEDRSGTLWFGSWGAGLGRLDPETGQFRVYVHDPQDPRSLSGNAVFAIEEDTSGDLWIGTLSNGLNRFDRDADAFVRYKKDPADRHSLSNDMVLAIHRGQGGTLWIGTGGGGLNRFDPQTETFTRITESDGLASNTVFTILSDEAGSLWMGTPRGLSRFDPQRGSFRNYTASDGLQGDQFNDGAAYKSGDGEMFFGGPNGITAFFPDQIQDDEHPPPVVLTNLRLNYLTVGVGGDSVLEQALGFDDEIRLSQEDRVLSFDFASLSYRTPEKDRCRYMLEGFDRDWTEVDSRSCSATYTNLDPGEYLFLVKGSNGDGVWNEEGVSISVVVPTPWWQAWWFLGSLGLALVGFSVGAYRWRIWNVERRATHLEAQVAQRTQELEASEQQFRNLVERISDVIYAADTRGNVTYVSPAIEPFLGYSPAEVIGQHLSRFIDPDDLEGVTERFEQFAAGESLEPMEYRMVASSGEVRWTRASSMPILDGERVVGVRGVLADITARRQVREQRERVIAAAERQRLARDLHDSVSQTLYSIAAIAEALPGVWERQPEVARQALRDLGHLARGALAEMRTLLLELRPSALVEEPLDELLRQLVDAARANTLVPIILTLNGECSLPSDVRLALYRIAQQGLNNAIKHAHADQIRVGLYCQPGRATLGVSDNGRGFDSDRVDPGHFGLSIMRERAAAVGAEFNLETARGSGTEITIIWIDPEGDSDLRIG